MFATFVFVRREVQSSYIIILFIFNRRKSKSIIIKPKPSAWGSTWQRLLHHIFAIFGLFCITEENTNMSTTEEGQTWLDLIFALFGLFCNQVGLLFSLFNCLVLFFFANPSTCMHSPFWTPSRWACPFFFLSFGTAICSSRRVPGD